MKEGTPPPLPKLTFSKLEHISMKEGTPPPATKTSGFYAFQTGTHLNERRHPSPSAEAPIFSRFPNRYAPLPPLPKSHLPNWYIPQ